MQEAISQWLRSTVWLLAAAMLLAAQAAADDVSQPAPEQIAHDEHLEWLVEQAVAARLAGIPRPRYIPATDLAPPVGLLLYQHKGQRNCCHGCRHHRHADDFPFAMALSGFFQLRWFQFARGNTQWTDSAGVTREIFNINAFNIDRFRIGFKGHIADERLVYDFSLFGSTTAGIRSPIVPIGLAGWQFSEAATVGAGLTLVPGTREWLQQSPWTIGVDRSMANLFFRPGFSPGFQSTGAVADGTLHYLAGVWNAIDGGSTGVLRRGTSMAWAGNIWWEPAGPFGYGASDMEVHADPVVRIGTSGVYALSLAQPLAGNNPEDTIVRLSDGTRLSEPGALGPGTEVDQFLYRLASIDAGWKWRGVAVNFEYYFRLLDNFIGVGDFDRSSVFDQGGMAYLSWCFVPRSYEIYARSSVVTGPFGTGQEYGGGLNWYIRQTRQARLTLEALSINKSPAQNFIYPYRAGATGTAIQTQLLIAY